MLPKPCLSGFFDTEVRVGFSCQTQHLLPAVKIDTSGGK